MVLGSGYRLIIDALGPAAADRVHADLVRRLRDDPPDTIISDVLFGRAIRD
jgi:hypothetical protein